VSRPLVASAVAGARVGALQSSQTSWIPGSAASSEEARMADSGRPAQETPPDDSGWQEEYWRRNVRLMVVLLSIWFVVSYVFGILLVEVLNQIVIGGFPLGFWFAQQGSIYTFVLLILVYAMRMDRLDREYGVDERGEEEAVR
jgi:putative solute:sodium symporter small subunit